MRESAEQLAHLGRRPAPQARFLPLETLGAGNGHGDGPAPLPPATLPLPAKSHPPTSRGATVAVDGSHAVLVDNGALWVVAIRVAAVTWPGPASLEPEATVVTTTPGEAQARIEAHYVAWGLEAPRVRNAEGFAEALRSLEEAKAAVQAVSNLPPGSLLLTDGALQGLPPGPQALANRIRDAAQRAGVVAVGVAKRSSLAHDGLPLATALQRTGPPGTWAVEVEEGIFVARLHPRARHAFRIDAPSLADVARLLPLCRDAVYTGYPYPLALAHNAVALTNAHARELSRRLWVEVRRAGGAQAAALLADFHEVLDLNT